MREDVQPRMADVAFGEERQHGLLVNELGPCRVDENVAGGGKPQPMAVDKVGRLRIERQMEGKMMAAPSRASSISSTKPSTARGVRFQALTFMPIERAI